jgi:hypothetical protein
MPAEDLRWGAERGDLKLMSSPNDVQQIFGRLFGRASSDPRSLEPWASAEHGDPQALRVQEVAIRVLDLLGGGAALGDEEASREVSPDHPTCPGRVCHARHRVAARAPSVLLSPADDIPDGAGSEALDSIDG